MDRFDDRQRLDKWLFFARLTKSRSAAAKLVLAGYVRVNGQRTVQAAKLIQAGDVVTVALERQVRVLRILAAGVRRGPPHEASGLFDDLSEGAAFPASRVGPAGQGVDADRPCDNIGFFLRHW